MDAKAPVTAERLNFLKKLSTERSESVPLQLLPESDGAIQEFAVVSDDPEQSLVMIIQSFFLRHSSVRSKLILL